MKIKDKKGYATIDFMFAMVLATGVATVFISFAMMFTIVEITQYIAFSTSREYFAARVEPANQVDAAKTKYMDLYAKFKPLFSNGWFEIPPPDQFVAAAIKGRKDMSTYNAYNDTEYPQPLDFYSIPFIGVRLPLTIKILPERLVLLGEMEELEDGFKTNVTSFLGREPTLSECMEYMKRENRFENSAGGILKLDSRFGTIGNLNAGAYVIMEDNGC